MSKSTNTRKYVDWNGFYRKCEERRDHSDDIYRIALLRAERSFRNCHDCGFSDETVNYERLANIVRGIRMADSMELVYDVIHESKIELSPFEKGAMSVLCAMDVTTDMKFIVP